MFGYEEELQEEIAKQKALLKEAYEAIVSDNRRLHDFCEIGRVYCAKCHGTETGENGIIVHKDKDCIVNKAEQWLKENRSNLHGIS